MQATTNICNFALMISRGTWVYKMWPNSSFIFNRELQIADHYLRSI